MLAKIVLLGVLTVTSYRPTPAQTKPECRDRFHCTTSIDDGITMYGVAASQDLLKSGRLHYGDVVYIEGYGYRIVNDTMNARHTESLDMLVFTRDQEKAVGVRKIKIYKLEIKK